ncbi:hypothetical protein SAMN04487819_101431 [Actinopolyspora alba]|uniref:Uncharacterized protein n=1 Tax=Actinopolyspora alba TaxID=673379 RepID=A0A1I1TX23_9ACTN|nr:hypothetical protein SAMN04487819_101431 [Actinopolyspora alba]
MPDAPGSARCDTLARRTGPPLGPTSIDRNGRQPRHTGRSCGITRYSQRRRLPCRAGSTIVALFRAPRRRVQRSFDGGKGIDGSRETRGTTVWATTRGARNGDGASGEVGKNTPDLVRCGHPDLLPAAEKNSARVPRGGAARSTRPLWTDRHEHPGSRDDPPRGTATPRRRRALACPHRAPAARHGGHAREAFRSPRVETRHRVVAVADPRRRPPVTAFEPTTLEPPRGRTPVRTTPVNRPRSTTSIRSFEQVIEQPVRSCDRRVRGGRK